MVMGATPLHSHLVSYPRALLAIKVKLKCHLLRTGKKGKKTKGKTLGLNDFLASTATPGPDDGTVVVTAPKSSW